MLVRKLWRGCVREARQHGQLYVLLAPAILYLLVFHYWPMYGAQIAFRRYSPARGVWGSDWVGLKYFQRFFDSYLSGSVIWNTVYLNLLALLLAFPLPIILSLLLNQLTFRRFKRIVQTVTYAPHFISTIVMVGMLNLFLSPTSGMVNRLIEFCGGEAQLFMGQARWFRTVYLASEIWQHTGWSMILFLATLSGVSPELYESARIDGANRFALMRHIDVPTLLPVIVISMILRAGSLMNSGFEKVYAMQNSMNLGVSEVVATYTYKVGLIQTDFSYSTAVGLFNSVVNFILLTCVNWIAGRLSSSSLF